ncbi:MAG: flagellar basal-body MS-ring/collar protein FliF [Alphaproteobacteria bacterium]
MNNLVNTLKSLGPGRLAAMAGIAFFLLGFLVYFAARFSNSRMAILYSDLDPADSASIVKMLEENNVNYLLEKNGTEISVPETQVARMKIEAASNNLPALGSGGGYEIFDNGDALGSTSFVQNINLVRAMEGELSKTLRSMDNIANARVHLVLPKREMFTREENSPSASVIIHSKKGKISQSQVIAIQKLIAASVPKMEMKNVSVIDNTGKLLTREFDNDEDMLVATNEERRLEYQRRLTSSIENMLERTVGVGKVRAEVNVEMDFSRIVTNEEIYDPETQVLRSAVTVEDAEKSEEGEPDVVTVGQNLPGSDLSNSNIKQKSQRSRTEETVNYEISKKVVNAIKSDGVVRKISVAVIVDGTYDVAQDGTKSYQPRSEKEMEILAALVRSTIGYDANRGDQVEIANMQFSDVNYMFPEEPVVFMGFTKSEVMRMSEGLGVALVAILVIFLVIRPLINKAFEPTSIEEDEHDLLPEGLHPQLGAPILGADEQMDELIDIAKIEGRVKASSIKKISEIVEKHPDQALGIIRNWMYQE